MSKLFAKYLINENELNVDSLSSIYPEVQASYLSSKGMIQFKCMDIYDYISCGWVSPLTVCISEEDLLRMLKIDTYSEEEQNEFYYHKMFDEYEKCELDDDVYWNVSMLQYLFHISKQTIRDIKKEKHLYKLRRSEKSFIWLKKRQLHSKGGRPKGAVTELTEADRQNIELREVIILNCVKKDYFLDFLDLHRLLVRAGLCKLSVTGIKWKFYILRYQFKLQNGFVEKDLEYEKKLTSVNLKYNIFENLRF